MCWISEKLEPLVSDGNVKVFKICGETNDSCLCGFFRYSFKYVLNKTFKTKIIIDKNFSTVTYIGNEGFHSYSQKHCMWMLRNSPYTTYRISYIDVYTKFNSERLIGSYAANTFNDFGSTILVEGYIPKGGLYYINEIGEIISDSIVLTNIIEKIQ